MECSLLKTAVIKAELTRKGRAYILSNPKLRGPIPWNEIFGSASIIAAIAALFVGCIRLAAMGLR